MTDKRLKYELLIKRFPWIVTENQNVIISPDVDGILSGLFMSNYFNWVIVGYYDGKQLAIRRDLQPSSCIFLDMEIYRQDVKSCGHHMLLYNKNHIPSSWDNFINCINPNILRGHDAVHNFSTKYPFAMIHFLLCLAGSQKNITISTDAISPLLYVDGTFKNLLNYPENCISWLKYLGAKDEASPVYPIFIQFANRKIAKIIHDLEAIFGKFKEISGGKRGGDKIKISEIVRGTFTEDVIVNIKKLIHLLSNLKHTQEYWLGTQYHSL